jgi:hypothetical protein
MKGNATIAITVQQQISLDFPDANKGEYNNEGEDKNEKTLREFKKKIINKIEGIDVENCDFSTGTASSLQGSPDNPVSQQPPPLSYSWTIEMKDNAYLNQILDKIKEILNETMSINDK